MSAGTRGIAMGTRRASTTGMASVPRGGPVGLILRGLSTRAGGTSPRKTTSLTGTRFAIGFCARRSSDSPTRTKGGPTHA